jgi:hypothetical protein
MLYGQGDFGSRDESASRLSSSDLSQHRGMYSYMPHCKLHKLHRYAHFRFCQFHFEGPEIHFSPRLIPLSAIRHCSRRHASRASVGTRAAEARRLVARIRSSSSAAVRRPASVCTLATVRAHSTTVHHVRALPAVQVESAGLRRVARVS